MNLDAATIAADELVEAGYGIPDAVEAVLLHDEPEEAIRWAVGNPGVVEELAAAGPADIAILLLTLRSRGGLAKEIDLLDRVIRETRKQARPPTAEAEPPGPPPTLSELLAVAAGDTRPGPLAEVLDDLSGFLRRYVWFPVPEQVTAVALWVAHTYAIEAAETSPRLSVRGPAKRCGKTRLVEALDLVVFRPFPAMLATPATIYRTLGAGPVTVIIDEVDTVFAAKDDRAELRAVINAGQRRGATVPRSEPDPAGGWTVVPYPVFAPMVLSGIGTLPDTIEDRAVIVELARKTRAETVERFRARRARRRAAPLCARLAAWALHGTRKLADAEPDLPDALNDRAQDGWEPLLAIADSAGGEWPERARSAAARLAGDQADDDTTAARLLASVQSVFRSREEAHGLWSAEILDDLNGLEDAGWGGWNDGRGIKAYQLARYLKTYGVRPRDMKRTTPAGETNRKGYYAADLEDAWARYLPAEGVTELPGRFPGPEKPLLRYPPTPTTDLAENQTLPASLAVAPLSGTEPLSRNGSSGVAPIPGEKAGPRGLVPAVACVVCDLPCHPDHNPHPNCHRDEAPPEGGRMNNHRPAPDKTTQSPTTRPWPEIEGAP